MQVLALTIFISLILAAIFLVCFFWAVQHNSGGSVEQDSLLPLRDGDYSRLGELIYDFPHQ